jgi:hypothetical protein
MKLPRIRLWVYAKTGLKRDDGWRREGWFCPGITLYFRVIKDETACF